MPVFQVMVLLAAVGYGAEKGQDAFSCPRVFYAAFTVNLLLLMVFLYCS